MRQKQDRHGRWWQYWFGFSELTEAQRVGRNCGRAHYITTHQWFGGFPHISYAVWMRLEPGEAELPVREIEERLRETLDVQN